MAKIKKAQLGSLIKAGVKAFGKSTAKSAPKTAATVNRLKNTGAIAAKKAPAKAFKKDLENDTYFKDLIKKTLQHQEKKQNLMKKLAPTEAQKNRYGGKVVKKSSKKK